MLGMRVETDLDKTIHALNKLGGNVKKAQQRGLETIVTGVHSKAYDNLSGPGRKKVRTRESTRRGKDFKKTRFRGQSDMLGAKPGSYPIPVLTGHLRRSLYSIFPGRTKTVDGLSVTAGMLEAVLWNSARYGKVIHEGEMSSEKHGPRPYATDAVEEFDRTQGFERTMTKEILLELRRLEFK